MEIVRLAVIGLVAGVFSAIFGVGGGIVVVPLLVLALHMPTRQAAIVSLGAIGITATAGAIRYGADGYVHVGYAGLVGVPAALGAIGGTSLQRRLSGRALGLAFAALVAAIGVWMLAT